MRRMLAIGLLLAGAAPAALANGASIRSLPVPAATIAPGQVIGLSDLAERRFKTTPRSLAGVATARDEVVGKEARRRLIVGQPIPLSALTRSYAIRRGAKAMATFEEKGLSISTQVLALEDGTAGDMIEARNLATGVILRAEVLPGGTLAVRGE